MRNDLPTGTITFLFTDIEGSTQLWERYPDQMKAALARHDGLLRGAVEAHNGRVVKTTGDGCHAVFAAASDALAAALAAQRELATADGRPPTTGQLNTDLLNTAPLLHVRMGLHTGEAELREGDYFGSAVNRAARIMSIGHGGQVLLSGVTAALVGDQLPAGVALRGLGDHRLRDLSRPEQIYQLLVEGLPSEFPPLKSLDAFPGNLPVQLTSFVGRERELADVKDLLAESRLLTLTGPGGTGKTRLSLQAAADVQSNYAHGAWLAELAPLADPALVPAAVAGLFELSPQLGLTLDVALADYLRGKELLLILDNCEHLVEACADLSARLLPVAPRLTILASSREGLSVPGETTYHVPTLGLPEATDRTAAAICRHDAADLFLQRARAAQPGFAVTDANAAAVGQIVRRLDGIPLAIELAAARVRLMSPQQIAARLDDRFRLLTGGSRTALPRQQTLRALIDWSYTLLSAQEATLFRRLGVFVGGWTLEAAEQVTSDALQGTREEGDFGTATARLDAEDVLDLLAGLVNKSLVAVDDADDLTRYHFLETIRQYARDKLFESGEGEAARDRHLAHFEHVLNETGVVTLDGYVGQIAVVAFMDWAGQLEEMEHDVDNVRAALEWALARDPERALLMAAQFSLIMVNLGSGGDRLRQFTEALAAVEALPPAEGGAAVRRRELRTLGYMALGMYAQALGDSAAACDEFGRAEALAREQGDVPLLARALVQRSLAAGFLNDDDALAYGEEAAALFRQLNDSLGVGQALSQMATMLFRRGEAERAMPLAQEGLAAIGATSNPYAGAMTSLLTPYMAFRLGDIATAEALYRAGLAEFRRLRNPGFVAVMQSDLGHMLRQVGRRREALDLYREAIRGWQNLGRRSAVANMLENYAFIAHAEGLPERAVRLLGAAEVIRDEIHMDMTPWERTEYEIEVAVLRDSLPPETFATEWAAGRGLSLDEAVDYAVEM